MILNTGGRTDTVQYYSDWLLERFAHGEVLVRNPLFPNKITRYALTPDKIDCVVFCSKNYAPILPRLHEITDKYNTYFHYTITAYGPDIEPRVPSIEESIQTLKALAAQVGRQRVAWRYDPVLLTEKYTITRHIKTFARIAKELAPHIDRCIFSFVELYKKLETNMPELRPIASADKETLARELGKIAQENGIWLQSCATPENFERYGVHPSGCITLEILGRANGIRFRPRRHGGMRANCRCVEWRDIGAYDTCPNGCRYCYANRSPSAALANHQKHDPHAPLLLGRVEPGDTITQGAQPCYGWEMEQTTFLD